MIASLAGIVLEIDAPFVVLEVSGVGYELQLTLPDLATVVVGQPLKLHIHQVIREDSHLGFGFIQREQREWFKLLIKITGLGPKLAMAILSVMRPIELIESVYSDNYKTLTKIPGIGNKMAQRLIVELKGKVKSTGGMVTSGFTAGVTGQTTAFTSFGQSTQTIAIAEATSALVNLGYKSQQAQQIIDKIEDANSKSCEELIREALKLSTPRSGCLP